ncbi:LysE family translocator [Priestia megaterium]|nr:LysE family translocator [Priestia megaterium]
MEWAAIFSFLGASIILTLAPGPDNLFVISQSIIHGKKAGIVTAFGLCSGITVHTLAAAFGVAALLHQSSILFQLLKFAGAAYLLYLAWQAVKERNEPLEKVEAPRLKTWKLYRKGILMNVLNPKVSLFFLAFLPQFVSPNAENPSIQMIVLGFLFMLQAVLLFSLIAIGAGTIGSGMMKRSNLAKFIHTVKAALFAVIGIRIMLIDK